MLTIDATFPSASRDALFENASLALLPTGPRPGSWERTAAGKTTLFHLIQGHIAPEQGTIEVNRKARDRRGGAGSGGERGSPCSTWC